MGRPRSALTRLTRRNQPEETTPWVDHPGLGTDDTDPAGLPAAGYPHQYFAIHHPLPTGEPNRGDELLWVATEISRHAEAGTLDENNHHLLNTQIQARHQQWLHAIDAAAARRASVIEGLIAGATNYSIVANEHLVATRTALAEAECENRHWRSLLLGDHPALTPSDATLAATSQARSTGITPATPTPATPTNTTMTPRTTADTAAA